MFKSIFRFPVVGVNHSALLQENKTSKEFPRGLDHFGSAKCMKQASLPCEWGYVYQQNPASFDLTHEWGNLQSVASTAAYEIWSDDYIIKHGSYNEDVSFPFLHLCIHKE